MLVSEHGKPGASWGPPVPRPSAAHRSSAQPSQQLSGGEPGRESGSLCSYSLTTAATPRLRGAAHRASRAGPSRGSCGTGSCGTGS